MEKINKFKSVIFASVFFILFIAIVVNASVDYLSSNLVVNYSSGDTIKGKVNLRIADEPGDSLITSNFEGNITLLDLIEAQSNLVEGEDYTCSTEGCIRDYTSSGVANQLQTGARGIFAGFKLEGSQIYVTDAQLRINSNAQASCTPNIYVDLLADGENILTSSQSSTVSCGIKYRGCYNQSNVLEAILTTGKKYCEKITIPAGPSFVLGGKVRQGLSESNLTMSLYDFNTNTIKASCKLPQNNQNLEELSCIANYSAHETNDYFVCISTSANNNYKIGWETTGINCGTAQESHILNSDFNLFAETMKYAAAPSFVINKTTYYKAFNLNLTKVLNDYLEDTYLSDCQGNSCFLPIKIFGPTQTTTFNNIELNYESAGASVSPANLIYELDYQPSKISADNISLDISKANFVIPIETNQNKFKLYIDEDDIFEKSISIRKSFLFGIEPKFVAFGQNVLFNATSSTKIIRTIWNFGDGTTVQNIDGTSVGHVFTATGSSFNVNVTAISNTTQATRQFTVFVGNPKDIANLTIIEYKKRITNITNQINTYPSWAVTKIQSIVDLNNMTSKLNSIEIDFGNSTTEQDYQNVMLRLVNLDVPAYVSATKSGSNIPLSVGYENINPSYLEQIENKDVDNEALRDKIIGWMNGNFNAEISFRKIERIGNKETSSVGTIFIIKTNPTSTVDSKVYLVLGQDIKNLGIYMANYNPLSVTSGVNYVILDTSKTEAFEFFVSGDVDAENLGAYIAPSLELLGSTELPEGECTINNICDDNETADSCPEDCSSRWLKFTIFGWIILGVVAIVFYIILQEWYKHNYQKSLFPENNDLYNLIEFIYNARKSGLSDKDIYSRLYQQKWSKEKINFAFRKIEGKRVGMLEIPIFTRKEHKETVQQISNRQKVPVDARFIKRQSYS